MSRTLKFHTEVGDTTSPVHCFGQFESVLGKGRGVVSRRTFAVTARRGTGNW